MHLICPGNHNHKRFGATAHVTQDWEIDELGNFINCIKAHVETTHEPSCEDVITCITCGEEALKTLTLEEYNAILKMKKEI